MAKSVCLNERETRPAKSNKLPDEFHQSAFSKWKFLLSTVSFPNGKRARTSGKVCFSCFFFNIFINDGRYNKNNGEDTASITATTTYDDNNNDNGVGDTKNNNHKIVSVKVTIQNIYKALTQ